MINSKYKNRKGFVLMSSLLIISILIVLLLACISRLVAEYTFTSKFYNSTVAFNLAEAGIERSIRAFNADSFGGWGPSTSGPGLHTLSPQLLQANVGNGAYVNIGYYDASINISSDGMSAVATASGYVPSYSSYDEKRTVIVTYKKFNAFSKAVTSLNNITMSNTAKTDSYDSSKGAYDCVLPDGSRNTGQRGSVTANGSITLNNTAYINGDANPGPGHPFPTSPPPSKYISGSYGTLQAPITVDPVLTSILASTVAAAKTSNSNGNITVTDNKGNITPYTGGGDLSLSNSETMAMPGGTYYFTSISLSNSATININGPSTIYVDGGSITVSNTANINNLGQPSMLQIYSTGNNISLSNSTALYGAIYAPSATVTLSNSTDFFGSIFCGADINSNTAAIRYDVNLLNISPAFAKNGTTSWEDVNK